MSDLYTLQDPTKQYPQPKFKRQTQRAPGLDKKMVPKADHGETSYRGSGRRRSRLRARAPMSRLIICRVRRRMRKR